MFLKRFGLMCATVMLICGMVACTAKNTEVEDSSSDGRETGNNHTQEQGSEKIVTLTESFDFAKGFYPVFTESTTEHAGITHWGHNFYDNLLKYENGEIKASLATDWDISEDGTEYTFSLRDDVKFSDGSEFTSEAVKISFEKAIENLGMYNGSFGRLTSLIESMETPDSRTFVLKLTQPYYGTLNDLTMYTPLAIVNPKAFEKDPFEACTEATMGTGPYMYDSNDGGKSYKFVRNPYYWGENPEADGFVIKVIADNDSKVLALNSGEIDAIIGASRMAYDAYNEMAGSGKFVGKISDKGNFTDYIGMNLAKEPFDDIRVRQAISHAIDRNLLSEKIYYGINTATSSLFERTKPFCDVETTTYEYDLEKAKALLDEAGWVDSDHDGIREKDGQKLEFTMIYTNAFGNRDDVVSAIAAQLGEVGISIKSEGMDMLSWFGPITDGSYTITLFKTYGGAFDPTSVMTNMNPEVATDPVVAQFDKLLPSGLIVELDKTADSKRVEEIYKEVLEIVGEETPVVPIDTVREFGMWNSEKISDYTFPDDSLQVEVANFRFK